ncbi:MAG: RloB family protein [Acholeplasmataceae bacterium]
MLKQFGRHLFYSEGTRTEPLYVADMKKALRRRYRMTASDIVVVTNERGGRNTLGLVDYAIRDVAKRIERGESVDHVWIFYDRDSFRKDDFDNAYNRIIAKNKAKYRNDDGDSCDQNGTRWHALWSNECFELWVLLHFRYSDASLSRADYIPLIDASLAREHSDVTYSKNEGRLFRLLERYGNIRNAVRWAKKLDRSLANPTVKNNPSTGIYQLMEYFSRYLNLDL